MPEDNSLLRVLIVDDQSPVRHWIRHELEKMGITEVTEAGDGRDALAAVTQPGGWFDLILCDLQMPERDGVETIRSFGALGLQSGIAIMSVEDERVIETAGMLADAQGLRMLGTIQKPVTVAKLEPILKRMREVPGDRVGQAVGAPDQDFPNAFKRTELIFLYQPKVRMRTGEFAGAEALVRWKHPEFGLFEPASFVPAMEEHDRYRAALADFSLREAIACAGRWRDAGRELPIAINLSARVFDRLDLPERIEALAHDAHLSPDQVTLEVTETQVARDATRMIDVLTRLRLRKFALSIDNFGTGQSGPLLLQKLPFNELKIDRSVVDGCSTSPSQRKAVESSLALARSLEMTSVAGGIQQQADWDVLEELGCDVAQGYFIARPMTEQGLETWVTQYAPRPAQSPREYRSTRGPTSARS